MAKSNDSEVLKQFREWGEQKMEKDADRMLETFFNAYLIRLVPAEGRAAVPESGLETGGHLHETWCTALTKSKKGVGARTKKVVDRFDSYRSGDPKAVSAARSRVNIGKTKRSYSFGTTLPFASAVEDGRPIRAGVKGNEGRKHPSGIGKLYGRRQQGRNGMLMWVANGQRKFAKTRTPSGQAEGVGAFAAAFDLLRQFAEHLGWQHK